jgi:hypothetical protein
VKWLAGSVAGAAVFAATLGVARAQDLPAGTAACRASIERQRYASTGQGDRTEPKRLRELCPEILGPLDASVWGQALARGTAEDLTGEEFIALADLAARYAGAPAHGAIATAALDAALAEVQTPVPPPRLSLWERAMRWLGERFDRFATGRAGWLAKWLQGVSLPERWARDLLIGVAFLLAAATAFIVVNELKIAGTFRRRRRREPEPPVAAAADDAFRRPRSLTEIRRAPLRAQPGLVLGLVIERLRARLPLGESLTHRELLGAARSLDASQQRSLRTVATAAERVTYGDWQPETGDVETLLADGEALLASLAGEASGPS